MGPSEEIRVAGARDVRATVDAPDADAAVVACPPHPKMGGTRRDPKLRAVGEALADAGVACVRFDYGPWDEGEGEQLDARNALAYARDHYDPVGLFGYSFGAGIALAVAAEIDTQPAALSVLAPPSAIGSEIDVGSNLDAIECPVQVLYGKRDSTVDWEPVVERAREREWTVESVAGDHFFAGRVDDIGATVGRFFEAQFER